MRETMLSLVSAAFCTGGSSGGLHCQSGVLVCRAAIPGAGFVSGGRASAGVLPCGLNTAGIDAMTTLPGLGEKKARAILEYRLAHGRFQSLDEVAQVPGVTQDMIDEWQGLAYVS